MVLYDDGNDENLSMAITTALLESQTPIAPDAVRATRMRAKLLTDVRAQTTQSEAGGFDASGLYTLRAAQGSWITMSEGIEIKLLRSDSQSRSYLLRLHPGARVPPHQHVDVEEECYVLEGEAYIGDLRLRSGDYHLAPRGVPHDWLRSDTGALLLLRADLQAHFLTTRQ